MAKLDIGKAALTGFRLIGREPMAFLGWALFLLVVVAGPFVAFFGYFLSIVPALEAAQAQGREPSPQVVMGLVAGLYALYPLVFLSSIVGRVMIAGAVLRAVLEPEARSWAYFRFGMGELWLALTAFISGLGLSMVMTFGLGLAFAFGVLAWQASEVAGVAFGVAVGLTTAGATIWLALRLSLAPVMSFAQREFRLIEGWKLTGGRTGSLLGLGVVLVLLVFALEILVGVVVVLAMLALGAGGVFAEPIPADVLNLAAPAKVGLLVLLGGAVAVLAALFSAVFIAPWGEAYRQLTGAAAVPEAQP